MSTMMGKWKADATRLLLTVSLAAVASCAAAQGSTAHSHGHAGHAKARDLGTGAAFDKDGRLWVATKKTDNGDQFIVVQHSTDMGKTWTTPTRIQATPEPIAASGEARPHIAFGGKGELYVSYTSTVKRPHIGDIRFVRSLDGGKTFSSPITVHANRDAITHSFDSMVVDADGKIFIAWVDDRDARQMKAAGGRYAGSAVYYAVSNDGGATFKGDYKVADHSCECCRIGLTLNDKGVPVAMWRHVFAPNIRDHAIAELSADGKVSAPVRVTFDDWRIDACPHHGPSIAYGPDGTRHQVWFNGKEGEGAGALYAATQSNGKTRKPVSLGSEQASHPDLVVQGRQVSIVWKQFDGQSTAVLTKLSEDGGATWKEKELARTAGDSDKPYLAAHRTGAVLVWRTENDGVRVVPIQKEKP
ncbi:MAG TPA: sialidase family protein [Noviherbaspirillum sp.]|uniref:sialidase family protein n=1 Tax=Noviherbaspirillum sp. TaxID=1926288 RepID=UPI002DDCF490|nr:sialidase family protein [Noviherbaspirillum sp.]HEV2612730.1 sialidase family protein [Noviherbaspirillum sp.]